MSLTGALIAVFIQQWAQSYLQATRERNSPHHRARIRAFHAEGLENFYLHQVTRAVPILIHGSLFLFFSGLPIFLFNVNRTVFNVVVTWLGLCVAVYACITLMPIFNQKSPYYSPLSSSIWWCFTNTLFIICQLLKKFMSHDSSVIRWYNAHYAKSHPRWPSLRAMQEAAGRFAIQQLSPDIDYRALLWMFETLNDDDEFEQFFDALPSLHGSEALEDAEEKFIKRNEKKLSHALIGMMDRTLLSELVSEEVKQRRIIICTKAIGATSLLGPWWTLRRVLFGDWHGFSRSIHFGLFVQGWKNISSPITIFYAQYVVAVTLASVQERDDNWFELASGQLNESKSLLRYYYSTYGDSVQLANAIFIIRRTIQTSRSENRHRDDILKASSKTLELICRFDIQDTLPDLQHQFCDLWNQLVGGAQNAQPHVRLLCVMILKSIRRLYITLHDENTSSFPKAFSTSTDDGDRVLDDPRSYPECSINEHSHSQESQPVPDLELDEPPRSVRPDTALPSAPRSTDMMPALSSALVPVLSQPPTFTSAAPNSQFGIAPNTSHRVFPSPSYQIAPRPISPGPPFGPPHPDPAQPNPGPPQLGPAPYGPPQSYAPPQSYGPPQLGSAPYGPPQSYGPPQLRSTFYGPPQLGPVPRGPHQLGPITYASPARSFSDSPVPFVPEPARAHTQEPPVIPAGARKPISTPAPATLTHDIDANRGNPGPAATVSRLELPSIPPKMAIPETPPAPSLPTPASAAGSATAVPMLPVILSTPQERMPTPPKPPSPAVPQGPPVSPPDTSNVQAPPDTSSAHSNVGKFAIPRMPRAVPDFPPSQTMQVSTAPGTSRPLPFPTSMTGAGTLSVPSSAVSRGGPRPMMGGGTMTVPSSAVWGGSHTPLTGGAISVPSSALRRGGPVQTPATMPSVIKVNGYGEFSGLLHSSPHEVLYEGELYPTALHLFEARKFLFHRPDLADRIRQCKRVEEVISISAEVADFVRRDWGNVILSTVSKCYPSPAPRPGRG
jgi:hypothetical protein